MRLAPALLPAILVPAALAQQPPDTELLATALGYGPFTGQVAVDGDLAVVTTFDGATSHALVLEDGPAGWSVVDELVPSVASWGAQPTTCLALDGDTALVGYGRNRRAVFFQRGPTGWTQTGVVVAPASTFVSSFATAAAIEGDLAIIGASNHVQHRNLVYRRVGSAWAQSQTAGFGWLTDVEIANGLVVFGNGFRMGEIQGHSAAISGTVSIARILPNGDLGEVVELPGPPGWDFVEGRLGMSVATNGTFVSATWSGHPGAYSGFAMNETWIVTWRVGSNGWEVDSTVSLPDPPVPDRLGYGLAWDGEQLVSGLAGCGHWKSLREQPNGEWAVDESLHANGFVTIDHRSIDATDGRIAAVCGGTPIGLLETSGAYERLVFWDSPVGEGYCTAQLNSGSRPASLYAAGSARVAADFFTVGAIGLPPGTLTLVVVGGQQGFVANPGGSQGDLCLGAPFGRFVALAGPADGNGRFVTRTPLLSPLPGIGAAVQPGDTWSFQAWYRDANPMPTSNFSDARMVSFR